MVWSCLINGSRQEFDLFDLAGGNDFLRCCDDCGSILARCALVIPTYYSWNSHMVNQHDIKICTYTHIHMNIYIYIHLCMCGYAYMYMYMYIYIYRHLCHHPPASNAQIIFNPNLLAIFVAFEIALFPTWIDNLQRPGISLARSWRNGWWTMTPPSLVSQKLATVGGNSSLNDFMASNWMAMTCDQLKLGQIWSSSWSKSPRNHQLLQLRSSFWGNFPLSMCQTSQLLFQGIETACFSGRCWPNWSRFLLVRYLI